MTLGGNNASSSMPTSPHLRLSTPLLFPILPKANVPHTLRPNSGTKDILECCALKTPLSCGTCWLTQTPSLSCRNGHALVSQAVILTMVPRLLAAAAGVGKSLIAVPQKPKYIAPIAAFSLPPSPVKTDQPLSRAKVPTYVLEWSGKWVRIYVDTPLDTLLEPKFPH
ncbi:hypothetical protein PQX77_016241 [Marasmius sp. AFHP31]|nr:hypothetical protein PQX77_016241 [Marasmius sp. AFHP31]